MDKPIQLTMNSRKGWGGWNNISISSMNRQMEILDLRGQIQAILVGNYVDTQCKSLTTKNVGIEWWDGVGF